MKILMKKNVQSGMSQFFKDCSYEVSAAVAANLPAGSWVKVDALGRPLPKGKKAKKTNGNKTVEKTAGKKPAGTLT